MTLTITNLVVSFGLTFLITYLYFRSLIVPLNLKLNLQFNYHKRLITTDNIENFRSHLCSINWDFSQSSSSNALYNSFMDCLYPIYETCFPVKIISLKENSKPKPWFTSGLRNSSRRKYALYKQYCNNPTPANKAIYTKFRNKYNYLIKLCRKKYYHDKLSSTCSSLKQALSLIKSVTSSKHSSYGPSAIKDNRGNTINNPNLLISLMNSLLTLVLLLSLKFPTPLLTTNHI